MGGTNGLKSKYKHAYQKEMIPFWRHTESGSLMTYSDSVKEEFERKKIEFDNTAKFIQWIKR